VRVWENGDHHCRARYALLLAGLTAGACGKSESEAGRRATAPSTPTPAQSANGPSEDAGSRLPGDPTAPFVTGDDEADAFVPPQCPALGFDYALGCENCPESAITCPCNAFPEATGSEVTSFQTGCWYGTCFSNVSCEVWCASIAEQAALSLSGDSCPSSRTCATEADCGGGHCFGETADRRGDCADGADGSDCFDAPDCRGGFCGPRGCTSGGPDALCATAADCAAGKCVGNFETDGFGFCSTGKRGEKCDSDDDCAPDLYCHTGVTRCQDGELGAACHENEQCKSGACSLGGCVTGELGGDCDDDDDCHSGHCLRPEVAPGQVVAGTCISGTADAAP
jgi:hypothetical protein